MSTATVTTTATITATATISDTIEETVVEDDVPPPRKHDPVVEEVTVRSKKLDQRKEVSLLRERKRAAVVQDAISAQEISRTPDSNASDAMKRVVAATIVEDKYVVIRGLGGRYVSTLLNGVVLPSPDPDEPSVPLDLFPTSLLSKLTVAKSYDASLPGSFGGGAVMIDTNSYPSTFDLKLKIAAAGDTSSTFRDGLGYSGGSFDYFGFDDGARNLPSSVPTDKPLAAGLNGLTPSMVEGVAEDFRDVWSTQSSLAHPNFGFGATVGNTVELSEGKRLGYLGTISFGHKAVTRRQELGSFGLSLGTLNDRDQLHNTTTKETGTLGALLNLGLRISDTDELSLFSFYTHVGDQSSSRILGYNESDRENIDSTRLLFIERGLWFSQLRGRHLFPELASLELEWQGNASVTNREEPDTRDVAYFELPDGRVRFKTGSGSGERFFSHLLDFGTGGSFTLGLPLDGVRLGVGAGVQRSSRTFDARRFRFDQFQGSPNDPLFLPPEEMLSADNIGPSFFIQERTNSSDRYDASRVIASTHASADLTELEPLRVIGGVRLEYAQQTLSGLSPYSENQIAPDSVDDSRLSVLPSANFVYALTPEMNLRAAYSYTLARPQFRELAPFIYFDFTRRRSLTGNPELKDTRIHNGDLRWEWFIEDSQLFAASVFYKKFQDPIELIIKNASNGDATFANAGGADAFGAELEARTSFAFIDEALRDLRLGANVSFIHSKISLSDEQKRSQTNQSRPMQGQSPYVLNFSLAYFLEATGTELNASYNVFGQRIAEVGVQALPDIYEKPFHRLDLSVAQRIASSLSLKISASNLLNQSVRYTQGDQNILSYQPGVAFLAALEWTP